MKQWINDNQNSNTKRAYEHWQRHFIEYCHRRQLDPISISDANLAAYLRGSASQYSFSSLRLLRAAIHAFHRFDNVRTTSSVLVQQTMKTLRRVKPPSVPKKAIPIVELRNVFEKHFDINILNTEYIPVVRALFSVLLQVLVIARYDEVRCLRVSDLQIVDVNKSGAPLVQGLRVQFHKRKNDQQGNGHAVVLGDQPRPLSILHWHEKWRLARETFLNPEVKDRYQFLFCQMDNGRVISQNVYRQGAHWVIKGAGLDHKYYSTHSFRRGGATAALEAGIDPEHVRRQGGWKNIASVHHYREMSIPNQIAVSNAIARSDINATHLNVVDTRASTQPVPLVPAPLSKSNNDHASEIVTISDDDNDNEVIVID